MFVHIRGRGTYSMLEGIWSNASILQRAQEIWQEAIALTDLNGVYGVIDFYSKSQWFDVQPLIGVELPYIPQSTFLGKDKNAINNTGTLTLLALSEVGYHNLLSLVSASYDKAHFDIPCLDNQILEQYKQDIAVIVGGIGSYAYQSLIVNDTNRLTDHIENIHDIMWKDCTIIDITAQSYKNYSFLKQLDVLLLAWAKKRDLLIVASSGFLYPYKDQKSAYETALAIKDNTRTYNPDTRKVAWDHHILTEDEVRTVLVNNGHNPESVDLWIDNTGKLAKTSTLTIALWQALFPNYEVSEEMTSLYNAHKDMLIQE